MIEPKELARQARLLLSAAAALKNVMEEVNAEELAGFRYHTCEAINDMVKTAVTCKGVRVSIVAEGSEDK